MELYADYEPGALMVFLAASQWYGLEAAAELCEARGLVREQVFVLGRMGNARLALELIIGKLADIPQVIPVPPAARCSALTIFRGPATPQAVEGAAHNVSVQGW